MNSSGLLRRMKIEQECWTHGLSGRLHFDRQKFAECIVQECLKSLSNIDSRVLHLRADTVEEHNRAVVDACRREIEEHFGMEHLKTTESDK